MTEYECPECGNLLSPERQEGAPVKVCPSCGALLASAASPAGVTEAKPPSATRGRKNRIAPSVALAVGIGSTTALRGLATVIVYAALLGLVSLVVARICRKDLARACVVFAWLFLAAAGFDLLVYLLMRYLYGLAAVGV